QNFILSVTFCSIRQSRPHSCYGLLRPVTADVTLALEERSMFMPLLRCYGSNAPRRGEKKFAFRCRADELLTPVRQPTEDYGNLRKAKTIPRRHQPHALMPP